MIHDARRAPKEQRQRQRARTDDKLAKRQAFCNCTSKRRGLAALGGRRTGQRRCIEREQHDSVARTRSELEHRRESNQTQKTDGTRRAPMKDKVTE